MKINTGFLVVGQRCRSEAIYRDLLSIVRRRRDALLLDQWVINEYFGDRKTSIYLLPNEYNWRVLERLDDAGLSRVKVLHYTGFTGDRPKPWSPDAPLDVLAFRLWREYCRDLQDQHGTAVTRAAA